MQALLWQHLQAQAAAQAQAQAQQLWLLHMQQMALQQQALAAHTQAALLPAGASVEAPVAAPEAPRAPEAPAAAVAAAPAAAAPAAAAPVAAAPAAAAPAAAAPAEPDRLGDIMIHEQHAYELCNRAERGYGWYLRGKVALAAGAPPLADGKTKRSLRELGIVTESETEAEAGARAGSGAGAVPQAPAKET